MFKKLMAMYISLNLIGGMISPYLEMSFNTPLYSANIIKEECVNTDTEEYFPISDERGNVILTKKEQNRDCVLTKEVQGACIKWEQVNENFVIDADQYDAYRSRNHEGAMGSLLAMIGAYDQLEHLWSGWKGYCEKGTKTNFDWASDPMFWAGLVASAIMGGSSDGAAAGEAAFQKTLAEGGTEIAAEQARKAAQDYAKGFLADTALGKGIQGIQGSMTSALGTWLGEKAGSCLMAGGFDMAKNLYQYAAPTAKSDDKCDSVDEFCGDTEAQTEESDIITIDKQQYEDMIAQHPDFAEQITILSEENGVLTIRYKKPNEIEGSEGMNQAELQAMQEKMKQMQLAISTVVTAGKMAFCMSSYSGGAGQTHNNQGGVKDDGAGLFSVKNGIQTAVSMIPAEWLGPYGVLIKAAITILVNFLFSFNDINSCTNEDDADEAGTRHKKTYESLPHNLCHFVFDECIDNCGGSFLGMAKELRGYHYCCYDQILTKVLVIQLKAQLGRGWEHCTGITLRDLNFVSFRQCTAAEKQNGIDGARPGISMIGANKEGKLRDAASGGYDPQTTFQYKNKCIDLTEFKDHLKAQIGDSIDLSDFDSIFSDVKGQAGSM